MAITASAKKANKRSIKLRQVNLNFKMAMKKAIKSLRKAAEEKKDASTLLDLYKAACSTIDKAKRKNIIHKNNAARKKSRLSKLVAA